MKNVLLRLLPFLRWFRGGYSRATLRADLLAGVTVALVLIPQSMAYAQLAGLPAYCGLYAAFLPPIVASLFGSSNQLATGPVAVVSLLTSATLAPLATAGSAEYVTYALLLALLVGLFQLALGLLRLGLVVNFLSHPVVNGFTNAAALIIATSQLSKIFGVSVDGGGHHYETVWRVLVAAASYVHWPTVGMAALAFVIMIGLRQLDRRIPDVLIAVVVTTVLAWAIGFERNERTELAAVESPRTRQLVTEFNRQLKEQADLAMLRAKADGGADEPAGRSVCTDCHAARTLTAGPLDDMTLAVSSDRAVRLHRRAGLIDARLAELTGSLGELREELRAMQFAAVRDPTGGLRFFPADQVPAGAVRVGGVWRLRVGGGPLDERKLTMMGGGAVVGVVPGGLPHLTIPAVPWSAAPRLLFAAVVISLLGFMEAVSIAKAMASRTKQRLDPNQELVGQGLANIVSFVGQGYPVSGSFSRSAVNLQAGGATGLSNVLASGVVGLALLFLTPLLYHMPDAVLAAVIMMAVVGLLNVHGFVHAWKARRFDGITGAATFVATLLVAPHLEWGIFTGVALSLGAYLIRTMQPKVAELSLHADGSLRDVARHGLRRCEHIAAIRFDGPLNFASVSYLEDEVLKTVAEMPALRHVLIAAHGVNEIDASGEEMLANLVERLRRSGYGVSLSGVKDQVLDTLQRTRLFEKIGAANFHSTQLLAVSAIYAGAHLGSQEHDCPFAPLRPRVPELSLHPDGSLRDAERHHLATCRHVLALRFDGALNAATAHYLFEKVVERSVALPELRHVLLAAHGISGVDSAGLEMLRELTEYLRGRGLGISFSGFRDEILDALKQSLVFDALRAENVYSTDARALAAIHGLAHRDSSERECPLLQVVPRSASRSLDR